jgi:hypothetical protein
MRKNSFFLSLLLNILALSFAKGAPLTSVKLGDADSEKAAGLVAKSAPVETKPEVALGEPGRRLAPVDESEPASIAFDVTLDPGAQNYITLRLWGSDPNWTPVNLFTDAEPVINLGNLWWHVTREAPVPGRFLYRTFPIPIEVTRGKSSLRLRIETAGSPKTIGAFRNADQPAPPLAYRPSFAIYGIHTHTDPLFEPAASERQGPPFVWGAPAPKPAGYPENDEQWLLERARVEIQRALDYDVVNSRYDTGHRYDTRVLETLPLIYNTEWSGHFHERAIIERVRDAIDAHVRRQAAQGGDPGTMFYRGWGSHGRIAYAYSQIHSAFEAAGWLDDPVTLNTAAGEVKLSRRQAYANFFHDAFEWRRQDGRYWTNQPIYVSHTLYRLQKALRVLGDPRALTEAQALHYVHVAFGLEPLRTRTFSIESADAGYPYFVTTRAGLTREKGYVDSYGELSYVIVRLAEETGDPAALEFARKFLRARSVFRIPSNDTDGHGVLRGIGAMSWRGTTFPFRVAYSGIEEAAVLDADPVALRLGQLEIAHGRLHLLPAEPEKGPHWHPATAIRLVDQYRKIKNLPPTPHRLPTEPDQPNFVWSDPEDGVFVFRHGENQVFGSFYNLDPANGRAIGDRGIVHWIRPEQERLIEFRPSYAAPDSGLSIKVRLPFGERTYQQVPPPPGMAKWQEEPAEATDFRAGRAYFYHARMGPYVIAMNTTEPGTYRESVWNLPAIPGATSARDLATGEIVDLTKPLAIPAYTTRVFLLK